ncbi:MAG: nucleoside hydrolase [Bacteroidota bacterium]
MVPLFFLLSVSGYSQAKLPVLIDADTGNEVDDAYALVPALLAPSWEVTALCAAQWQASQWAIPQTMENSHRLNQVLLAHLGLDIPTKRGGAARMYDWGDMARHSAAAYEIIRQAKAMPTNQKLTVIVLGALTNVASAYYIDPSIADRIKIYWLGSTYNQEKKLIRTRDFNCLMDIQALHVIFDSPIELHVMPLDQAGKMVFSFSKMEAVLGRKLGLSRFLLERWEGHLDGGRKERTLWDIAIIQAVLFPDWVKEEAVEYATPDGPRSIYYYYHIEAEKMKEAFYDTMQTYLASIRD